MKEQKISYSHQGQDLILLDLFRNQNSGTYVDVGCNHPIKESNTYLLYKKGWSGFAIDAEISFENEWLKYRERDLFINAAIAKNKGEVTFFRFDQNTMSTIDKKTMRNYSEKHGQPVDEIVVDTIPAYDILLNLNVSRDFELLCCDVEGKDLEVLESINLEKFRPKVILVEIKLFNFMHPTKSDIMNFLYTKGYVMLAKTPLDGFFVDRNENLNWIPETMLSGL
jgi:FkbM family methyltransferase